jgi:hypothetical protein
MAINLFSPVDGLSTTLASSYSAGSGSFALSSAAGWPTGGGYCTGITAASYQTASEALCLYTYTGITGNTLTGVSAVAGFTDRSFGSGDLVEMRATAEQIAAAYAVLANLFPGGSAGELLVSTGTSPLSGASTSAAGSLAVGSSGQLNYAAVAPSSPSNGDSWYDSVQLCHAWRGRGLGSYRSGVIYVQTSVTSYTSGGAAASVMGSGVGSFTLPAGFLQVGTVLEVEVFITYTSSSSAGGYVNPSMGLGSSLTSGMPLTVSASATLGCVWNRALMTCTATGTSGTVQVQQVGMSSKSSGSNPTMAMSCSSPLTVNTTAAQSVALTLQNSTAGTTFTVANLVIRVLA